MISSSPEDAQRPIFTEQASDQDCVNAQANVPSRWLRKLGAFSLGLTVLAGCSALAYRFPPMFEASHGTEPTRVKYGAPAQVRNLPGSSLLSKKSQRAPYGAEPMPYPLPYLTEEFVNYDNGSDDTTANLYYPNLSAYGDDVTVPEGGMGMIVVVPGKSNINVKLLFLCQSFAFRLFWVLCTNVPNTDASTYVKTAVTYAKSMAGKYNCNPDKTILMGYSEGGITVGSLTISYYSQEGAGMIYASVLISGTARRVAELANPHAPPVLMVHDQDDTTVPWSNVPKAVNAMTAANETFSVLYWPTGGHQPFQHANFYGQIFTYLKTVSLIPDGYNYSCPVDAENDFGMFTWDVLSEHKACYNNSDGPKPVASFVVSGTNVEWCKGVCEQIEGCTGIDFIGKGNKSPNGHNCYVYTEPMCTDPSFEYTYTDPKSGKEKEGAASYTMAYSTDCEYYEVEKGKNCPDGNAILSSSGCLIAQDLFDMEWGGSKDGERRPSGCFTAGGVMYYNGILNTKPNADKPAKGVCYRCGSNTGRRRKGNQNSQVTARRRLEGELEGTGLLSQRRWLGDPTQEKQYIGYV